MDNKKKKDRIIIVSIIFFTIVAFIAYKMNINYKLILTIYNIITILQLIYKYILEYRYKIKYEPLLDSNFIDLSELIDKDDDEDDIKNNKNNKNKSDCYKIADILGENESKFSFKIRKSTIGIQFSLLFWIYIDNANNNSQWMGSFYSHRIVYSLNRGMAGSPVMTYLPKTGDLYIWILTGYGFSNYKIARLRQQKWIQIVTVLDNRHLDIFINGVLAKSFKLNNVPIIGTNNITFGSNGGFYAKIAIPRYFNRLVDFKFINDDYHSNKNKDIPNAGILWWTCTDGFCYNPISYLYSLTRISDNSRISEINNTTSIIGYNEQEIIDYDNNEIIYNPQSIMK